MIGKPAYGQALAERIGLDHAPVLVTQTQRKSDIAVTQCHCPTPFHGMTQPIPPEEAYLVALHIADCVDRDLWLDGRPVQVAPVRAGELVFYDLRQNHTLNLRSPFHALCFYVSRAALDDIADAAHAPPIGDLRHTPGMGVADPVLRDLGQMLLPAFDDPDQAGRLFVESVILVVAAHIAQIYGGMAAKPRAARGGLASWQARRAKDILSTHLDGEISIAELAAECGLSTSHFSRCFRQSTGLVPHQWLVRHRVAMAKQHLARSVVSLSDVGLACGFADQSHFTRVFTRFTGVSPGAWRRGMGSDAPAGPYPQAPRAAVRTPDLVL